MGKAKPAHHTSKELSKKSKEATMNRGGGAAGLADRKGGKAGHSKLRCNVCGQEAPDLKTMQIHFEARHPKLAFGEDQFTDVHALNNGVTTSGVAVRGSFKK